MSEVIVKRIDKGDGTFEYQEITAKDLPENLIKENPLYQSVLNETIERRKEIKTLKEQKPTAQPEQPKAEATVEPEKREEPKAPVIDEEALYAKFRERLIGETGVETKAEREARLKRENDLKALAEKYKVPDTLMPALKDSTNPEETAKLLSQHSYRFDDVKAGEVPSVTSGAYDDVLSKIKSKYGAGQ